MSNSENRNRTKLIQVRCTEEEYDRISESAKASGLTVSEYVRRISLRRRITAIKTDYALIAELVRLGKQQVMLSLKDGGIHSGEYVDVIRAIQDAIIRADALNG